MSSGAMPTLPSRSVASPADLRSTTPKQGRTAVSAIIDFTEAVYDLELSNEDWLPTVLKRGLPVLEHGLGVAGIEYGRPPDGGPVQLLRIHVASGRGHNW